jgi:hypothetical protein
VSAAIRTLGLALCVALAPLESGAAAITEVTDAMYGTYIDVDGSIAKGDYDAILRASKSLVGRGRPIWIRINSRGGNVAEAMKIGRFVRKTLAAVVVDGADVTPGSPQPRRCYSSCVLILIGAADRYLLDDPVVGIHRPYIEPAVYGALSPEQARVTYARLEHDTKDYLAEMGAPGRFVDEMFRTPSTDMRLVTARDFQAMFAFEEPFLEEWLISRCAADVSCKRAQLLAHQQSVLAELPR